MSEDPQALGARLKLERERRGMSTQKAANVMRLDEWVIESLESGDYRRIGPEVFARGHLKKYSSLLGVSPTAPVAPLPTAPRGGPAPPIVRVDPPTDPKALWPRVGTVAAAAVLAGAIFWWRDGHRDAAAPARASQPPAQPEVASAQSAGTSEDEAARSEAALPAAAPTAAMASPSAERSTPGIGRARLRLSFSADSWVDIRDFSGKRIFSGNGRANSVQTVTGLAPLRVHLRAASGVQLQLNERAVAIGRQFISGDEATFEAGADGVLRREPAPAPGAASAMVAPHG